MDSVETIRPSSRASRRTLARKPAAAPRRRSTDGATHQERLALGKSLRQTVPRSSQADIAIQTNRDPVELVTRSGRGRVQELLPIRHGRMVSSPFAFLRGSAMVMAADLAGTPSTGQYVQACGDAHLANFGAFASSERRLVFDLNDFDETHPAPWEWDVKRLAASIAVAGQHGGGSATECRDAVRETVRSYREHMLQLAGMSTLDVWYSLLDVDQILQQLQGKKARQRVVKKVKSAARRTSAGIMPKLTVELEGGPHIADRPPLIVHPRGANAASAFEKLRYVLDHYQATLPFERRVLLEHFRLVDLARKVVGVGSVGTRCFIALMLTADGEPLFLQAKEAGPSVLEPFTLPSRWSHHGERVVRGQRLIQAAGDVFLGWTTGPTGRHFYMRQLRDMKVTADVETLTPALLGSYGAICGWALARAHARTGDPAVLAGYLGRSPVFDEALVRFAERYARQTEIDHAAFAKAVHSGRVKAISGV